MRTALALCLALLLWPTGNALRAAEEGIALKDVPKVITDTVKARFPKGELKEASKEDEEGKTVYEVSVKLNGKNIDVTLTPEGTITMIESEIATSELPKAVTAAVEKKYPAAEYKLAEEVKLVENKKEKLGYYEVRIVTKDKKKLEIEILPDGKIKQEEDKSAEKDEK